MHLVVQSKYNSVTEKEAFYYRIKESFRNAKGNVCVRILLNIGFIDPQPTPEQWRMIIRLLNERMERRRNGQTDTGCDAHLYFGLLAYWVVNTIRHQLKLQGERMYWTEIVRIMST